MTRRVLLMLLSLALLNCGYSRCCRAQDNQPSAAQIEVLKAADDARVAAMKSPNKDKLNAVLSDTLHYAHSNGNVDTKSSLIDVLTSGKTKYVRMDYEKREFTFPAPGIALMTGRAHVQAMTGEATMDSVLSYLAVWRLEGGQWRFVAWQSCRLPPPAAK